MPGKDIIFKALESFPKIELEDIRHYFGAELPSRVRKSELVERLGAYIVERPEVWLRSLWKPVPKSLSTLNILISHRYLKP